MRRIIYIVGFLILTISATAQVQYFRATSIFVQVGNEGSGWVDTNILISWNTETKRVIINSREKQIIDYEYVQEEKVDGATHYTLRGNDSKYKDMLLIFSILRDNSLALTVAYTDEFWSYKIVVI